MLDIVHAAAARLGVALPVTVTVTKLTDSDPVPQFRRTEPLFLGWVLSAHLDGQLLRARRVLLRC